MQHCEFDLDFLYLAQQNIVAIVMGKHFMK